MQGWADKGMNLLYISRQLYFLLSWRGSLKKKDPVSDSLIRRPIPSFSTQHATLKLGMGQGDKLDEQCMYMYVVNVADVQSVVCYHVMYFLEISPRWGFILRLYLVWQKF